MRVVDHDHEGGRVGFFEDQVDQLVLHAITGSHRQLARCRAAVIARRDRAERGGPLCDRPPSVVACAAFAAERLEERTEGTVAGDGVAGGRGDSDVVCGAK